MTVKEKQVTITLTRKQIETLHYLKDTTTHEILFGGGAGGAKSTLGCYWLLMNCIQYPGTRWLLGRAKLKVLKETTVLTLFEVARKLPVQLKVNNQQSHIDVYSNKGTSRIFMKDLFYYPSDPDFVSLGSLEITGAFIDEANEITKRAFEVVRSRIRYQLDPYNLVPKILITCNPAKGWIYNDFYKPWRDNELPGSKQFIQALVGDNPFISKFYRQNLESLEDNNLKQRLLYGIWEYDDDEGLLIPYDKILAMYSNEWIPETADRYISADIAEMGSDKFVIWVWYGWVIVDFKVIDKSDFRTIENQLKQMQYKHRVPRTQIIYDADGTGKFLTSYLIDAVPFKNGSPPVYKLKKFKEEYRNLKSQCYFHLARKINDNQIYMKAEVGKYKEAIDEELSTIKNATHGKDGKLAVLTKEKWREILGRSPDFADGLMMRCYFDIAKKRTYGRILN